jgi:hypothetical protein
MTVVDDLMPVVDRENAGAGQPGGCRGIAQFPSANLRQRVIGTFLRQAFLSGLANCVTRCASASG